MVGEATDQSRFPCAHLTGQQHDGTPILEAVNQPGEGGGGPQKLDNVLSSESDPDRRI